MIEGHLKGVLDTQPLLHGPREQMCHVLHTRPERLRSDLAFRTAPALRKRSTLQSLSLVWLRKISQDGPLEPGSGR